MPKADIASKLVRAAKTIPETSVRHQDRNGHGIQDGPSGPAKDKLAQTRMAIAANDDHVGTQVCRQDRVFNVLIVGHDTLNASIASLNSGLRQWSKMRAIA